MTFVKLAGPAKIGGKRYTAGDIVEVGDDAVAGLEEMGLVAEYPTELTAGPGVDLRQVDLAGLPTGEKLITITEDQFNVAVAAKAEALAGALSDSLMEGLENSISRVEKLEAELASERAAHDQTRAQLEAALHTNAQAKDAPQQPADTPPSEPAENTASKKGAAAKAKG